MSIFMHPTGLTLVAHFNVPGVQTWGSRNDAAYKQQVREYRGRQRGDAGPICLVRVLHPLRCGAKSRPATRNRSRTSRTSPSSSWMPSPGALSRRQPEFHVRGVQVEAEWGPDTAEHAEVWILGQPK